MRGARSLVGLTLLLSLLAVSTPQAVASECWVFHRYERQLAKLTNASRADAGLNTLPLDPELSMAARAHSKQMVEQGRLFHSSTNFLARRITTSWNDMGENVGMQGTPSEMHQAFLNSQTHRDKIYSGHWDRMGVGSVKRNGVVWVTVLFMDGPNPGTKMKKRFCG